MWGSFLNVCPGLSRTEPHTSNPNGFWDFLNKAPLIAACGAWMDIKYPIDGDDITHWAELPNPPTELDERMLKDYYDMVNSMWRPTPPDNNSLD
jgi:hypothetical protein